MGGVQMYTIFGRQIGSHHLAMATLGTTFTGAWLALRGGGDKPKPQINASSKEEEEFLQEFIRQANEEDQRTKQKQ